MFIPWTFIKYACFVLYSTCVRFDLVKSPEVTLYKPSINTYINNKCIVFVSHADGDVCRQPVGDRAGGGQRGGRVHVHLWIFQNRSVPVCHFNKQWEVIELTHDIERRPTTTETRVAYVCLSVCVSFHLHFVDLGISLVGNSGRFFPQGKPAATESRYPVIN